MPAKTVNAIIIGLLSLAAFVLLISSIVVVTKNSGDLAMISKALDNSHAKPSRNLAKLEEDCVNTASMTRLNVSMDDKEAMILVGQDPYDPMNDIREISLVIAACPGRQLDTFCAGAECPGQQIKARLTKE